MTDLSCDVAVVGAGTAGLAAERTARRHGAKTLLVDAHFAGTTCATVGCMPSKLLIAAGEAAHAVRRAGLFGIEVPAPVVDGAAVMQRVQRERDLFVAGAKRSIAEIPDGIRIEARARFASPTTLLLDDGRRIAARAIVIATGSVNTVPEAFAAVRERVLTNASIFDLATLPRSVGIIGAGPLGLELAQALARLGVETHVFEQGDTLAGLHDPEVARCLHAILERELPITLGVEVTATPDGDGVRLAWKGKKQGERRFERVLVAAGRPPALEHLDLGRSGLALDEHGTPDFDRATLQCGRSSIFLAGDANHDRAVLHEAATEGMIAGRNAASFPEVAPGTRAVPMAIVFTDPAVAVVGRLPGKDEPHVLGAASYEDQGRAKVFARNAGLAHLYADRATGRLLGASMAGPGIEHSAHLIAWAIQNERTATEVLDHPFYHPTYEEGLKPALRAICKEVHAPQRDDEGFTAGS
jgi:dihydrolipoamide dehydrogenase